MNFFEILLDFFLNIFGENLRKSNIFLDFFLKKLKKLKKNLINYGFFWKKLEKKFKIFLIFFLIFLKKIGKCLWIFLKNLIFYRNFLDFFEKNWKMFLEFFEENLKKIWDFFEFFWVLFFYQFVVKIIYRRSHRSINSLRRSGSSQDDSRTRFSPRYRSATGKAPAATRPFPPTTTAASPAPPLQWDLHLLPVWRKNTLPLNSVQKSPQKSSQKLEEKMLRRTRFYGQIC